MDRNITHSRATIDNASVSTVLEAMRTRCGEYRLPEGAELFCYGLKSNVVHVLSRGAVKIVRSEAGGAEMILALRTAPAVLGLEAALTARMHAYSAVTVTSSVVTAVPNQWLSDEIEAQPEIGRWVRKQLCDEQDELFSRLLETGCLPAKVRLEYLIADLMKENQGGNGGRCRLQLPIRDWELAQFLCVTPEHLSRLFQQLQREGILRREKGWLVILNRQSIRRRDDLSPRPPSPPTAKLNVNAAA